MMDTERSYSRKEVEALLALQEQIKKLNRLKVNGIRLILKYGEKVRSEPMYWLVGEEEFDEWLKNPAVAKQKIKETRDRIAEVEQLISLFKEKLGSLSPKAR